jgi:hypothetical protein
MRKPSGKYDVYEKITGCAGTSHEAPPPKLNRRTAPASSCGLASVQD